MNNFILPHEFIGISFFDEEHPIILEKNNQVNRVLIIYHTAGDKI
jgi:hypothetical protein